jgi:AcrR family transcriptional regulator
MAAMSEAAGERADDAARILDAALALAAERGWDAVSLADVAAGLGIGLAAIQRHYRGKDDLAEAWFERADRALVRAGDVPGWLDLPVRERLTRAMQAWFDALAPHQRTTAAMLRYKLQPEHLHLQVQGLLHVSRTVQWIRETARLPARGLRREVEEAALTAIFLSTLLRWLLDDTPEQSRARAWLERRLAWAETMALGFERASRPAAGR